MKPARILVVDNNPIDLRLAAEVLVFGGYDVCSASTMEKAEIQIQQQNPDVALVDMGLQENGSLPLVTRLRQNQANLRIALLGFSPSHRQAALDSGANAYIKKPIDTRSLNETIRALLAGAEDGTSE